MLRELSIAVTLAASACTFSSPGGKGDGAPGLGEPDLDSMPSDAAPSGDAPDGDGDEPVGGAGDGEPTSDDDGGRPADQPLPPPSDPGDADDGDGAGDEGGADGQGESGDVVECDLGGIDVLWAADAELGSPMQLVEATQAADNPVVAVSAVEEDGEITFELDLPCAGEYYVWGLVWDFFSGAWPDPDADSFYFDVGSGEALWRYGCQTSTAAGGLSWQPLQRLDGQPCSTTPIVLKAPEGGVYTLTLRNREAGYDSAVAGIAAIAIGTDPTLDPYDAYAPY